MVNVYKVRMVNHNKDGMDFSRFVYVTGLNAWDAMMEAEALCKMLHADRFYEPEVCHG